MFIAGLWHGASWNFAVWGVGHGFALVVDHKFFVARSQGVAFLRHMWMFFMVILLWIPFRAHDMGGVYHIFSSFVNLDLSHALRELRLVPKEGILSLLVLLPSLYIVFRVSNVYEIEKEFTLRSSILLSLLYLVSVVVVLSRDYVPFLYFQF